MFTTPPFKLTHTHQVNQITKGRHMLDCFLSRATQIRCTLFVAVVVEKASRLEGTWARAYVCVCVCVCARARARANEETTCVERHTYSAPAVRRLHVAV